MRSPALLVALGLASGCGGDRPPVPPAPERAPARYAPAQLPSVEQLPCFKCHDFATWGEGDPGFPHALGKHKKQGHCHVCHLGRGHRGQQIDRQGCLGCHDDPPPGLEPAESP